MQQYSKQKHVKERTCQISRTESQVLTELKTSFCHEACATGQWSKNVPAAWCSIHVTIYDIY